MNIINHKKLLRGISQYFQCNRQAGHTTAALEGINNTSTAKLITATTSNARQLNGQQSSNFSALATSMTTFIVSDEWRGSRTPIVFDNAAVHQLVATSLTHIEDLEADNKELKDQLAEYKAALQTADNHCSEMSIILGESEDELDTVTSLCSVSIDLNIHLNTQLIELEEAEQERLELLEQAQLEQAAQENREYWNDYLQMITGLE